MVDFGVLGGDGEPFALLATENDEDGGSGINSFYHQRQFICILTSPG